MIIFKDSKGNIITKVEEGTAIEHHNRILINPGMFVKEGDQVMLWTDKNLKEYTAFYEKMIDKIFDDCMAIIETLKEENQTLQKKIGVERPD